MQVRAPQSETCACCTGGPVTSFYDVSDLPVLGAQPATTRAEALGVPRRHVTLRFCSACGYVTRAPFDPAGEPSPRAAHLRSLARRLRAAFDSGSTGDVTIELPDVLHALREGADWALCVGPAEQFSPGSLARLFRRCGLDVLGLRRDPDGQRFALTGGLPAQPAPSQFEFEDDLAALADAVDGFPAAAHRQAARWRRVLRDWLAESKRVAAWGAGPVAVTFLSVVQATDDLVPLVADPDEQLDGAFLTGTGQRIVTPATLATYRPDIVLVPDPNRRAEAVSHLDRLGLRPQFVSP